MGTLYVACLPAGNRDDIPYRLRRVLGEVSLVFAVDPHRALGRLDEYGAGGQAVPIHEPGAITSALDAGDAALLLENWLSCPSASETAVIRAAVESGHRVVPLPGPSLPIAALVASGLPAESFVHLGELPPQPTARQSLLAHISREPRTLLAIASCPRLSELLSDLLATIGDRPLALVAVSEQGLGDFWRGTLQRALEPEAGLPQTGRCILVVGGRRDELERWDEERLRSAVRAYLNRDLGVKETSRRLAAESGWPRREVYDLAVEIDRFPAGDQVW